MDATKKKPWWEFDPSDPARFSLQEVSYATVIDKADCEPRTRLGINPKSDDERDWRGVRRKDIEVLHVPEKVYTKYGGRFYNQYYLFDTPDYADPFAKLWWTLKYSFCGGVTGSAGLVGFGLTNPKSMLRFVSRYTIYTVGISMITTTSAILISNLRGKKDDWRNWSSGAFVAALWLGNMHGWKTLFKAGLYGTVAAGFIKHMNESNQHIFPNFRTDHLMRSRTVGVYGNSADQGWKSGDLRFGAVRNFVERARRPI